MKECENSAHSLEHWKRSRERESELYLSSTISRLSSSAKDRVACGAWRRVRAGTLAAAAASVSALAARKAAPPARTTRAFRFHIWTWRGSERERESPVELERKG